MNRMTVLCSLLVAAGAVEAGQAAYIPAKAVVAQILLDRAFEESVETGRPVRPWSWADMAPVARLSIQRIGMDEIALDKGSGQAMAFGPTLLPGTASPGQKGTSVFAAHRDTHFRNLSKVRVGDVIRVEGVDGKVTEYRVSKLDVRRWNSFAISGDRTQKRLVLATCYPFGAQVRGPWRFIVEAEAVS